MNPESPHFVVRFSYANQTESPNRIQLSANPYCYTTRHPTSYLMSHSTSYQTFDLTPRYQTPRGTFEALTNEAQSIPSSIPPLRRRLFSNEENQNIGPIMSNQKNKKLEKMVEEMKETM